MTKITSKSSCQTCGAALRLATWGGEDGSVPMLAAKLLFVTKRLLGIQVRGTKIGPHNPLKDDTGFCHEIRNRRLPDLLPVLPNI